MSKRIAGTKYKYLVVEFVLGLILRRIKLCDVAKVHLVVRDLFATEEKEVEID